MPSTGQKSRKWERYGCLLPCQIIPKAYPTTKISGRIVNIGRGGILMESDYSFNPGDAVTILPMEDDGTAHEFHGLVRWGQIDTSSLMGLFYIGIEFDELLPLKQVLNARK